MNDKTKKTTKADLFKMLSEAVRNTPGAIPIEPARNVQPELKSKPKRVAKANSVRTSLSRKQKHR